MTRSFAIECAAAAGLDLADPDVRVDPRGLQNLVIHAPGRVLRFPRRQAGAVALDGAAVRLGLAGAAGVPTPAVLDVVSGPVGHAHLVLSIIPGVGLDEVDTAALAAPAQERLARGLIEVADQIHAIPAADWPGALPSWAEIWQGLVAQALAVDAPAQELLLAEQAAAVAAQAPVGVFHGDLGGVNCRIDPVTGEVLGVLDWDSAAVGDVGTDSAAILAGVSGRLRELIQRLSPQWAQDEERYGCYVATWPLQHRIWMLSGGSPGRG